MKQSNNNLAVKLYESPFFTLSTKKQGNLVQPAVLPSMIIVGDPGRVNQTCLELNNSGLKLKKAIYVKDIYPLIDGTETGLLFCLPLKKGNPLSIAKNLYKKNKFKNLPFFAVVPNWVDGKQERQMYKAGFRLIFEWPKEKKHLSDLLTGIVNSGSLDVKTDSIDRSMEKAIKNRNRAHFGKRIPKINTNVDHSVAFLSGEVKSVSRKREVLQNIRQTPGLKAVADVGLKIKPFQKESESNLKHTVCNIVASESGFSESTIELKISSGNVKIIGTASSSSGIEHLKSELEKIEGVSNVKKEVKISTHLQTKDENLARRISTVLRKLNLSNKNKTNIKVINGVAKLNGSVNNIMDLYYIQKAVQTLKGVNDDESNLEIENNYIQQKK